MNPEVDGLVAGARSMGGFGFASQTRFVSVAGTITASSSGEQDNALVSSWGVATRERVWVNAEVDQSASAKQATITRGNSFRSSINREVPSLN
jgi:hypothetical protein